MRHSPPRSAKASSASNRQRLWLAQNGLKNPDNAGAASVDYLRMMGIVAVGWMWARIAERATEKIAAKEGNRAFYEAKLVSARYWMERVMPDTASLLERLQSGAGTIMELDAANF